MKHTPPLDILILPAVSNMEEITKKFPFKITLTKGYYRHIEFIFQGEDFSILYKGKNLRNFSFVWLSSSWHSRDLAYAIKLYLEKYEIPHTFVEKGTSKVTDHTLFALHNLPVPHTLFLDYKDIKPHLDRIRDICDYPVVIKDIKGSKGSKSVLAQSEDELLSALETLPKNKKYLFQQYIPNDYDWGVLVANGEVVSGEKSYPQEGEFRNNTCNGAREVFIEKAMIPKNIQDIAIQAGKSLGLSWSRSDIIIDKNTQNPYLMEVNRLPGLTSKTSEVEGAYTFLSQQIQNSFHK